MRFRRNEDQEKIAERDLVRLLPTMRYTPNDGNPIGVIGRVLDVTTFLSICVSWFIDRNGEHLEVYNNGYQMGRDIEKVIMYLDPPHIKYNSKEVVIL